MIHTNKIAYLYLSILITAMVSMALPNPLYMAIIFVMNMSVTLSMITSNPEQPVINKISLWLMIISAIGFNLWAAYQSFSYFTLNPTIYLTLLFYIVIYYFLAIVTFKPSIIMNAVIYLKVVFKGFLHLHPQNTEINNKTMIFDILQKSSKKSTPLFLTIDGKNPTETIIDALNPTTISLKTSPSMVKFSEKTLTKIFEVHLVYNKHPYFFKSSFVSLDPLNITLPTVLSVDTNPVSPAIPADSKTEQAEAKPPFDLSTLKSSVSCGKKNIEFDIESINDSSVVFNSSNPILIESIKTSTEYIDIIIFIKGSIVKIQVLIDSNTTTKELTVFNATIKNIAKKDKELLLSTIS